jgi:aspartyl-tRNA(Asn)/glutamyl-tRNA(Gln) amidotransferase subunit A
VARRQVLVAEVCAGLFPAAPGTDTGGSVRNPASACGMVGLKPTYALLSRRGVFPLSFTLDYAGLLTCTVADSALMIDAIVGYYLTD